MKIALIEPPCVRPRNETIDLECEAPIALASLVAVLIQRGHEAIIIDAFAQGFDLRHDQNEYYTYIGISFDDIAKKVADFGATVVGISSIFYFNLPTVMELVSFLRQRLPEIKIVLGGVVPTTMYNEIMRTGHVDFIVLREGDYIFPDLIENLNDPARVAGVVWRKAGIVCANPEAALPQDLDRLPFPARELLDLDLYIKIGRPFRYVRERKRFTNILTSRGCPFSCTFCSARSVHGRTIRYRSPESVLAEIDELVNRFGIDEIHVIDENFSLNRTRAIKIMDGLIERGYHKFLSWTCPNGLFINSLDAEMIDKMQESNCHSVSLAIESGDEYVSKYLVKKQIDLKHAQSIVRYFKQNTDILLCGFFIIGFPGETKEQVMHTINFANKLGLDNAHIAILMPYPFTEVYEQAVFEKLLTNDAGPDYYYNLLPRQGLIRTKDFSPEWLRAIRETDRFLTLLRKKRKSFATLCRELIARNSFGVARVAGMILYHALKGDLSGN